MFKNYFKTTLRSFGKNRVFALINIFGLSIGLTAAIFIFQYTYFQFSFDDFHDQSDRIYRVINDRYEGDKMIQSGQITYSAVGPQLAEDYPEVLDHTTINVFGNVTVSYDNKPFTLGTAPLVENSFFQLFSYPLIHGNSENIFNEPFQVALSESLAQTMFGTDSGLDEFIGETIFYGSNKTPMQLVGIFEDVPHNSSLQFDILFSRETVMSWWGEESRFSWVGSDYFHYIVLAPNTDVGHVASKLDDFSDKYFKGNEVTGTFEKFKLQPLDEVHLNPIYEYENHDTADGRMVWILVMTAGFILIMAWVNYVNLTTSRALQRAKEVGLRKVIGASRAQLISQFMLESFVLNMLALAFSLTLIQTLQAGFVSLIDEELVFGEFLSAFQWGVPVWAWLIIMVIVGAFTSGIYPSFVLSKYKPSETLKGDFSKGKQGFWMRKGLVVFQFILSTVLIGGSYLVVKQTNFMRHQNIGADIEHVLTVKGPAITSFDTTFVSQIRAFLTTVEQNSKVIKAGSSTFDFGERLPRTFNVQVEGKADPHMLNRMGINYGFLDVYKIDLLAGRGFRPDDHTRDWQNLEASILNAEAARLFGFDDPQDAINKKLSFFGKDWRIVGITADFHQRSLKESIEPLIMLPLYEGGDDTYHFRISGENIDETVDYVASVYDEFYPGDLFDYSFTDQQFESFYKSDRQFGKVFNIFSVIAILIACLGLFGLVGFAAVQKTKEIGIRKVLGASVADILGLISKEFLLLIFIASCIALPFTYWAGKQWLEGYAYQTNIPFTFFIIPLITVLIIATVIIIGQTMKTAQENPVKALHQD